ncbi:MJ0042-type zinc finger domain-containing protein [Wolbachia endosymbiont of Mansonella ozzardi]|uniref:MJ0042-type zinc finger domain-containing protein n=1 Tax=Wolbachia endosymbiont of Mansonella ozzardi TaxID=137464 RepID=UPI001CE15B65|nr:MJ0042-type zinc finger domain-containing protein [Wolbachia endosymbiont of Mansonella ozzardi]
MTRTCYYSFVSTVKIQCNNCTKTYLASSEQRGKFGRKVKCTNCNHTWYEYFYKNQTSYTLRVYKKKKLVERVF